MLQPVRLPYGRQSCLSLTVSIYAWEALTERRAWARCTVPFSGNQVGWLRTGTSKPGNGLPRCIQIWLK
jgi:hypothetical protein